MDKMKNPEKFINIFLVEDDQDDIFLFKEILSDISNFRYSLNAVGSLGEAKQKIKEKAYDIIISDLTLPDSTGLMTFEVLFQLEKKVPIIILTGLENEELALKAVSHGAQDYLIKGQLESKLLSRSIQYAIERKKGEVALLESEGKFHTLVNNLPDVIMRFDQHYRHLYVNQSVERIVNIKSHDFIGKTHHELGFPEEQALFWENSIQKVFDTRQAITTTFEFDGPEGYIIFDWRLVPEINDDGSVQTVLSIARDITEQKKYELALKSSEEKNKLIIDTLAKSGIGLFIVDENYMIEYMNPIMIEWFGDQVGTVCYESLAHLDRRCGYCKLQTVIEDKVTVNYQAETPNQQIFDIVATPIIHSHGKVSKMEVIRDITDQKKAEKALRESEEMHRLFFETMNQGVIYYSAKHVVTHVNQAALNILGLSRDQIDHPGFFTDEWEIVHEDGTPYSENTLPHKYVLYTGKEVKNQVLGFRKPDDKDFHWILVDSIPLFSKDEFAPHTVYTIFGDITERKKYEEQVKNALHEKDILLKEIHHRVKNNMQVISSLLNLQSMQIDDEQTQEMFKESQNRIKSMALIHERLYQTPDLSRIDFDDYVRKLASNLIVSYPVGKINTDIDAAGIFFDAQIGIPCGLLINELVSNSLKYAFKGKDNGRITIRIKNMDHQYLIQVSDDGIGFPESLDFRNTSSLGLQLVNIMAAQLKGKVDLEVNEGTTFTISFPATLQSK